MEQLISFDSLAALATLTALEIVLGIDNIVFIAILTGRLPERVRPRARFIGLSLAMILRIALLLAISWIMRLTRTLLTVLELEITGKDLVLLAGGLFLIGKATFEIHHKIEEGTTPEATVDRKVPQHASFGSIIAQIIIIDAVFSVDSVITAVGMAKHVEIMITAIVIAVIVMMIFAGAVSRFIERHPTLKMLALAFLLLIGVMLVADGLHFHVPRGYVYFAMAFSLVVELLNIRTGLRRKRKAAAAAT